MHRVIRPVPPFEVFLEANRVTVYRFLMVAAGPAEADDVFQETFLTALRAYPRLRHGERLDRWILTIAARKAIDAHRARRRRPAPSSDTAEVADRTPAAGRDGADPDDPVWGAVRALPPRQRIAVVYRHVLDRPYAEIAELMSCSEETARANVHLGTKRLRATLEGR